jgi:hypothetical protein
LGGVTHDSWFWVLVLIEYVQRVLSTTSPEARKSLMIR